MFVGEVWIYQITIGAPGRQTPTEASGSLPSAVVTPRDTPRDGWISDAYCDANAVQTGWTGDWLAGMGGISTREKCGAFAPAVHLQTVALYFSP